MYYEALACAKVEEMGKVTSDENRNFRFEARPAQVRLFLKASLSLEVIFDSVTGLPDFSWYNIPKREK
jgi:hypothetical protein